MPHKRQMTLATKSTNTPVDAAPADGGGVPSLLALLDMAEAEAKIVHAIGARCPSPADTGLKRSLSQEAAGRCTLGDSLPSTPSAPPPHKSRYPWNPAHSALAAPPAHDADLCPWSSQDPIVNLQQFIVDAQFVLFLTTINFTYKQ